MCISKYGSLKASKAIVAYPCHKAYSCTGTCFPVKDAPVGWTTRAKCQSAVFFPVSRSDIERSGPPVKTSRKCKHVEMIGARMTKQTASNKLDGGGEYSYKQ